MRRIVVDANILFAAFMKDETTREILLDWGLELYSPTWLWDELAARYDWLQARTGLPQAALDELLQQLKSRITDIPDGAILPHKEEALQRAGSAGRKDAPHIAAALAVDGALWTHDRGLADAGKVSVVTTRQLVEQRA